MKKIPKNIMGLAGTTVLFWLVFGMPVAMNHYYYLGHCWLVWGVFVPGGYIIGNILLINFIAQVLVANGHSEEKTRATRQKNLDNFSRVQAVLIILTWVARWLRIF